MAGQIEGLGGYTIRVLPMGREHGYDPGGKLRFTLQLSARTKEPHTIFTDLTLAIIVLSYSYKHYVIDTRKL